MLRYILPLFLFGLPGSVLAQRDPPLYECFLPSITLSHAEGGRLLLDLVMKKETGPTEHQEHQMYLLVYLLDDEQEILKIASTPEFLDKSKKGDAKLFLDVLLEKGLVTIMHSKVAKRQGFAGQDNSGKYSDGSKAGRDKEDFIKLNTFAFSYSPTYDDLFNKVSKLKNFRNEDDPSETTWTYKRRFKMLSYVPVNDCKYATEISDGIRGKNDFGMDEYGVGKTPILYCRPLPFEFEFSRNNKNETKVYIR